MQTKKFVIIMVAVIALVGTVGVACQGNAGTSETQSSATQVPTGLNPGGMNPSGMGTTGTVRGINGNVITLATNNGSVVQVYTNSSTTIQEVVDAGLSDIAIGDSISVIGQSSQSGSINAISITIGTVGMLQLPGLQQLPGGMNPGAMNGSMGPGGMNPGSMNGSMGPSGMGGNSPGSGMGGGTTGTVSGISGNVITLTTTNGSVVQVYTDSSTTIQEVVDAGLSDIAIGDSISVIGQSSQSNSINANSITIGTISGFQGPGLQP
jgi:hypothetical protein